MYLAFECLSSIPNSHSRLRQILYYKIYISSKSIRGGRAISHLKRFFQPSGRRVRTGPQGCSVAICAPNLFPKTQIRRGAKQCRTSVLERGHSLYTQFLYTTKLPIAPRMGQLLVFLQFSSSHTDPVVWVKYAPRAGGGSI